MIETPRRILITSALPYVNNEPHLGNIIGCVLSGDVYARWAKMVGHDVVYICGTDEYGTATEIKAYQEGLSCIEICDKYHALHKQIYDWFGIQFDHFGRTSTLKQTELTHIIFNELYDNGLIDEEEVDQMYCESMGMFISDRFIEGYCYHPGCVDNKVACHGDQCDRCGNLIDVKKLIDPVCSINGERPIIRKSKQLYLRTDKMQYKVSEYMESGKVRLSPVAEAITKSWLNKKLIPRSITRDLKWGTPVPTTEDRLTEFAGKVFYVWFDAPIGYLSILSHLEDHERFLDPTTEWVQFMAKDNVSFHTIIFPATLLGCTTKYPIVTQLSGIDYLSYQGGKFSKSKNLGVFGSDAIRISEKLGIDDEYWRYYLLYIRPESGDSSFEWYQFVNWTNGHLVANLGNFVNRVMSLINKHFPKEELELLPIPEIVEKIDRWYKLMDNCQLRESLKLMMDISHCGNRYVTEKAPWVLIKEGRLDEIREVLSQSLWYVETLSIIVYPYLPKRSKIIQDCFEKPIRFDQIKIPHTNIVCSKPALLFRSLKLEDIELVLREPKD